jgi:thioredoxin reductase (NADPH)
MQKVFDVIIVGTGPAGLTGAVYTARAELSVLALRDPEGSNLEKVAFIGNYFGFPEGVKGPDLLRLGEKHATKYGALIKSEEVLSCKELSVLPAKEQKKFSGANIVVKTQRADYGAKALLIAAGMQIRSGGIENEFKYFGRGVAVCVACDGPFFKKKKVMIVGAGNLAANEAIELSQFTKDIVVNTHGEELKMDAEWEKRLREKKIPIVNKRVAGVHGNSWVEELTYMDGTSERFEGLFLALGTASATDFARSLGLEMDGNAIKVNSHGQTNLKNVWAAGDVTGAPRQIGKSVGDGVRAAINMIESLRGGHYVDHRET